MFTEIQFKGLYTGRLACVEYPEIMGFQIFGAVFIKFKHEMYAEQRVKIIALLERAKKEGVSFSLVLVFPDEVEFSGIDMNAFKEIYVLLLGFGSHLSMVCGNRAIQKLKSFSRTQAINVYGSVSDALINTKPQFLIAYNTKMTRNIIVLDSDPQQRNALEKGLMLDRFSAFGVATNEEAFAFINKFGRHLDGAILEFKYPTYKEVELVKLLREINPDSKIIIHSDVLEAGILEICQKNKITSVVKSPFKPVNLLRKFKVDFPERETNYLGFSE